MRRIILFSVLLFVFHIATKGEEVIIEMTTEKTDGNIHFQVGVANSGTTLNVDFGDGTKVPFTINNTDIYNNVWGEIKSNTIKVFGEPTDIFHFKCISEELSSLDVSNSSALTSLDCTLNELTTLDLSNNSALTEVTCPRNSLTTLDFSNNPALTELRCGYNDLTSLNVSSNSALTFLVCDVNSLTSLDLSNNSALTELYCNNNRLTDLDVSNNLSLQILGCSYNDLATLDVSNNTALVRFGCDENNLTTLDVSNNVALIGLNCYSNNLTSLDVSNNTALTELLCYQNNIASLDVRSNTALTKLICGSNSLTALDVSQNTALTNLSCHTNTLSALDVSNNLALERLSCNDNEITTLDVSNNSALEYFNCYRNNLTSIDVSNNPNLNRFECGSNNMTFSSLPQEGLSLEYFFYSPQSDIPIDNAIQLNGPVDLSAESDVNGNITSFVWKDESDNILVEGTDYTIANGVTRFLQPQQEKVYCEMTNPLFPSLTLKSTLADVVSSPTGLAELNDDDIRINSVNKTIFIDTKKKGLLTVVDLSGRVIVQENINSGITEIPVINNGVYIVSVSRNGQSNSKKLLVSQM